MERVRTILVKRTLGIPFELGYVDSGVRGSLEDDVG